jgi:hypothetical protein
MASVRLKGTSFHGVLNAVEKRFGRAERERAVTLVAEPTRGMLETGEILTGGWYDAQHYDALLAGMEAAFPHQPLLLRKLSHDAITHDFSTLFRFVRLVLSPESALANAVKVTSRYVEGGTIRVLSSTEGQMHFRFEDYVGYTRRMWDDFLGGMEAILDLMKVQRLPSRVVEGGDGPTFEVILRYSR